MVKCSIMKGVVKCRLVGEREGVGGQRDNLRLYFFMLGDYFL
jgi:hypothetical protein